MGGKTHHGTGIRMADIDGYHGSICSIVHMKNKDERVDLHPHRQSTPTIAASNLGAAHRSVQ